MAAGRREEAEVLVQVQTFCFERATAHTAALFSALTQPTLACLTTQQ